MWERHADRRIGATTSRTFCADVAVSRDNRSRKGNGNRRKHSRPENEALQKENEWKRSQMGPMLIRYGNIQAAAPCTSRSTLAPTADTQAPASESVRNLPPEPARPISISMHTPLGLPFARSHANTYVQTTGVRRPSAERPPVPDARDRSSLYHASSRTASSLVHQRVLAAQLPPPHRRLQKRHGT